MAVLGPLEVFDGTRVWVPSRRKERSLLAVLALDVGRTVRLERLVDALWQDDPPAQSARAVRSHVHRMRAQLGGDVIATDAAGYRLALAPDDVDAHRFERLAANPATTAAALALWRGDPYGDLVGWAVADGEIARLEARRAGLIEDAVDIAIADGRYDEAVAHAEANVRTEPLRERRWCQLMRGLYAAGRQADALRAFERARRCSLSRSA